MVEAIIVIMIVGITAVLLGRSLYRTMSGKSGGCGGKCAGCSCKAAVRAAHGQKNT